MKGSQEVLYESWGYLPPEGGEENSPLASQFIMALTRPARLVDGL